jgi:hypothetical protein
VSLESPGLESSAIFLFSSWPRAVFELSWDPSGLQVSNSPRLRLRNSPVSLMDPKKVQKQAGQLRFSNVSELAGWSLGLEMAETHTFDPYLL